MNKLAENESMNSSIFCKSGTLPGPICFYGRCIRIRLLDDLNYQQVVFEDFNAMQNGLNSDQIRITKKEKYPRGFLSRFRMGFFSFRSG